jgi:hypothetical protein
MVQAFDQRFHDCRQRGHAAVTRFTVGQLLWLLCDAADEWANKKLSSHPSFRGRCLPNTSLVRPPGVGKQEWFYSDTSRKAD